MPLVPGSNFLGAYRGFRRLYQAGLIQRLPRLFAVQAAACPPIYQAYAEGCQTVDPVCPGPTIASGIAVGQPAWGAEILAAVRATEGAVVRSAVSP
jgi:threonine synthase